MEFKRFNSASTDTTGWKLRQTAHLNGGPAWSGYLYNTCRKLALSDVTATIASLERSRRSGGSMAKERPTLTRPLPLWSSLRDRTRAAEGRRTSYQSS